MILSNILIVCRNVVYRKLLTGVSSNLSLSSKVKFYDFCYKSPGKLITLKINSYQIDLNYYQNKRYLLASPTYSSVITLDKLDITTFDFFTENNLSFSQWQDIINNKLIGEIGRPIKLEVFESYLFKGCLEHNKIELCTSYYKFNQSNGKYLNFLSLSYFLLLIARNISVAGDQLFLEICNLLKKEGYLPYIIVCHMISALSLTKYWKEGFPYLTSVIKSEDKFHAPIDEACNYMARAVFREEGLNKGAAFLNGEYFSSGAKINDETWNYIFHVIESSKSEENVDTLYNLMLQNNTPLNMCLASNIKRALPEGWIAQDVKILNRQPCESCGNYLKKIMICEEDIYRLKEACESALINKEDIFQTTTPEEWKSFLLFLKKNGPFDIVLDALNLLLGKKQKSIPVLKMIENTPDKKYLMVPRRHTNKMLQKIYRNGLPNNLFIFFLNDYTKDDGFLLYAAFYSGIKTKLITRDFLRDHRFLLGDPELRKSFDAWQKLNQIRWGIEEGIYNYIREPQWTADKQVLHIPLNDQDGEHYHFTHKTDWLCIKHP